MTTRTFAAQVAAAGATADPVKDYLKQIGKVPLLTARRGRLAKRIRRACLLRRSSPKAAGCCAAT